MELLLIIVVIILLFGGIGTWPSLGYHHDGYGPSGLLFVIVVILIIVFLLRRRRVYGGSGHGHSLPRHCSGIGPRGHWVGITISAPGQTTARLVNPWASGY